MYNVISRQNISMLIFSFISSPAVNRVRTVASGRGPQHVVAHACSFYGPDMARHLPLLTHNERATSHLSCKSQYQTTQRYFLLQFFTFTCSFTCAWSQLHIIHMEETYFSVYEITSLGDGLRSTSNVNITLSWETTFESLLADFKQNYCFLMYYFDPR